ncbi:MAG TPA: hypothetical protein VIN57_05765, partial [Magnetovibrio sp.]
MCIALSVVGGVLMLPAQAIADPVNVQASTQDGYGRLTFRWPQPVGHQAKREGDRLVVSFSRPIQADLRPALRSLGAYIASIEPTSNEATVAFRLKGDFSVRSYDAGSSVVVDIVGAAPTAAPASVAPAAGPAPASTQGTRVPVRTGVHDAYSRVVFDWPAKTAYTLTRDGSKAVLSFAAPAAVNVATLASGRIRNISGASADAKDGKLTVTLNVDPTSDVKTSTSGAKVIVDV